MADKKEEGNGEQGTEKTEKAGAAVEIVTGTKMLKVGGKEIRVPVTAKVSKLSDLKPELIAAGGEAKAPRFGPKDGRKCAITIDGQRLTFDKLGNLVL